MANDHMSNNSASMDQEFHDKYTVKMIRNGRLTTLIAALLTLVPPLYLWLVVGFKPTWGQIGAGWSIMFSAYFLLYFFEPLGFYPQMGLSGIYIGYLAGNIPSVRLPAMLALSPPPAVRPAPSAASWWEPLPSVCPCLSTWLSQPRQP